jgi:hypothetical protein
MSGPVNPPLKITDTDGTPDIRPAREIILDSTDFTLTESSSGTASISIASGAGSSLTDTYIGFGSASDELTGSANFTFTEESGATGPVVFLTGDKPSIKIQDDTDATDYFTRWEQSGNSLYWYADSSATSAVELVRATPDYVAFMRSATARVGIGGTGTAGVALHVKGANSGSNPDVYIEQQSGSSGWPLHITTPSGYKALLVESTVNSANGAPDIEFFHNKGSGNAASGDYLCTFHHSGLNDADETIVYVRQYARAPDVTDGSEDGSWFQSHMFQGSEEVFLSMQSVSGTFYTTFNEAGVNADFRIEALNSITAIDPVNAIKMDGATGYVGLGTGTPAKNLHVSDGSTTGVTGGTTAAILITDDTNPRIYFEDLSEGSGDRIMDIMADSEALTFNSLNDAASAYDKQNIFVINRDGYVSVNGQPDTTGDLGLMQINVGNSTQAALTLISTDADADVSPTLDLYRHSGSPADGDDIGKITFSGEDDGDAKQEWASISGELVDASAGSEDARLRFRATTVGGSAQEYLRMGGQDVVFNESSGDINFRVESNGNATMLVIDGGDDVMGVGATPTASKAQLQVNEDATFLRYIGENTATMDITPQMLHNTIQTLKSTGSRVYASLPDVAETVAGMCMTFVSVGGDMSIIGKTDEGQSINGVAKDVTEATVAFDTAYSRVELIALSTSMWTCWVNGAIAVVTNT